MKSINFVMYIGKFICDTLKWTNDLSYGQCVTVPPIDRAGAMFVPSSALVPGESYGPVRS